MTEWRGVGWEGRKGGYTKLRGEYKGAGLSLHPIYLVLICGMCINVKSCLFIPFPFQD